MATILTIIIIGSLARAHSSILVSILVSALVSTLVVTSKYDIISTTNLFCFNF